MSGAYLEQEFHGTPGEALHNNDSLAPVREMIPSQEVVCGAALHGAFELLRGQRL